MQEGSTVMNIGERVFYLLKLKGKKQTDLANTLAIPKTTVNGWRQNNKNPSADLIVPISEYFGVSCEYLLTGEEKQIENSDNHIPTNDELL